MDSTCHPFELSIARGVIRIHGVRTTGSLLTRVGAAPCSVDSTDPMACLPLLV